MLTVEQNEELTQIGPGTPMGELMRRYWIPVAFAPQVAKPGGAPVRVRLLCEDLVLFRDGEAEAVGQGDRRRLSIAEQTLFPVQPLIDRIKAPREDTAEAAR